MIIEVISEELPYWMRKAPNGACFTEDGLTPDHWMAQMVPDDRRDDIEIHLFKKAVTFNRTEL